MLGEQIGGNFSLKKILITPAMLCTSTTFASELYEISLPDAIEYVKQDAFNKKLF